MVAAVAQTPGVDAGTGPVVSVVGTDEVVVQVQAGVAVEVVVQVQAGVTVEVVVPSSLVAGSQA